MSIVLVIILSYLLGSIPSGLIVGKVGYGVDIREMGSGNLGGTNTFRSLGKTAGIIVIVSDILKGTLAAALPYFFGLELNPVLAGIPAVIGHCYPIFAGFRGGKAVATSAGVLLLYSPLMIAILAAVFLLVLYLSKYVSLSSMIGALAAHLYGIIDGDQVLSLATFVLFLLVLYRHRANWERIMNGTESKVKWI